MKSKLFAIGVVGALLCGAANAVVITVTAQASTAAGLVTTGTGASATLVSGTARIYSTTTDLTALDVASITTETAFVQLLTSPLTIRNLTVTSGAFSATGSTEAGTLANRTYLFISSTDGNSIGIFKGANVPNTGALTFTPAAISQDFKGTSVVQTINGFNSGWQLVAIPEPSSALLGMLGALGLLRRRR